ncbi:MAG: peptidylprolyl isomerase [Thermomicrobiales bacterium]|nr:peptidylprolyl isomerase [Thermomicrobiales bacterium]
MPIKRLPHVLVLLLLVGVISACGVLDRDGDDEADTPAPTALSQGDADIESGCWTAADRVNTEGDAELANIQQWSKPPEMQIDGSKTYSAKVVTNKGDFTIDLLPAEAPLAVNNFVCLARAGFYDNTPVHRIVAGFVIQGGDPTGTGAGGPGYRFNDEPISLDYEKGTVAMANAGPNTNGSQFFVVLDDLRGRLGKNYTIFGKVTDGMDVVDSIGKVQTQVGRSGEKSSPVDPITIESVTITES